MIKTGKNSWSWQLREPSLLDSWFDDYPAYIRENPVKKNPQRTVFKVGDRYFVKLFTPHKLEDKVREMLFPRARSEFETGVELERAGLPVVRYLGWGRRLFNGMLVTAAEPDSRTLWERRAEMTPAVLAALAELTRQLVDNKFYHPDYHAGNILFAETLKLVDVYGVQRIAGYGPEQRYGMSRMILGMKEFISDAEAVEFLLSSGLAPDRAEAAEKWDEYLGLDGARLKKDWEKRSRQIISNYNKFVIVKDHIVYRKLPDGTISDLTGAEAREYAPDEAERKWLESFRLEIAGIPCRKPLALENGTRLYWENAPEVELSAEVKSRIKKMILS